MIFNVAVGARSSIKDLCPWPSRPNDRAGMLGATSPSNEERKGSRIIIKMIPGFFVYTIWSYVGLIVTNVLVSLYCPSGLGRFGI